MMKKTKFVLGVEIVNIPMMIIVIVVLTKKKILAQTVVHMNMVFTVDFAQAVRITKTKMMIGKNALQHRIKLMASSRLLTKILADFLSGVYLLN